jgi:hypothetical protein
METYQSKERVLAIQVKSIEGKLVNGEILLGETFVSQYAITPGVWLIHDGIQFVDVMTDSAFNAKWELDSEESVDPLEGGEGTESDPSSSVTDPSGSDDDKSLEERADEEAATTLDENGLTFAQAQAAAGESVTDPDPDHVIDEE